MLENYFSVLVFIAVGVGVATMLLVMGAMLGKRNPSEAKGSPYECGFPAFDNARMPFNVRFYLVAILFLIFDLETAFFFPWAVVLRHIGWAGFLSMMFFLGILVIGFIYEWKKGGLEWD